MNKLVTQHYNATSGLGKIDKNTHVGDFIIKMAEELKELQREYFKDYRSDAFKQEAIDLIAAGCNMLKHMGYDVEELYKQNIKHQETRKD